MTALYKQQLGAAIKARREALGLTQRQLAEAAGVQEAQTVSRWERGERAPVDLDAVARGLQTTATDLLAELDPITNKQRRAMGSADGTQLDRVEARLERIEALLSRLAATMEVEDAGAEASGGALPPLPPLPPRALGSESQDDDEQATG